MPEVPRRIVTGHDETGKSVVLSDAPTPKTLDIGTAVFHELWATSAVPAAIDATEPEPTTRPLRTPPDANGIVVRFTEMSPGAASPMHRTESVDVGIVLDGETWLLLDDGSETRMGAGDVVVQRGTNHAWENRSERVVKMAFVMIDGTIGDGVRATAQPLEFFDAVLD
ncbi:cupin domain-containing protein [Solirubrobacter ginsenosidimutans]|uniref:Cupin domain-containing protein n=1 Tax=Solirubrobacter ginsenosidimutans TaxID=490573 RepID=A0A9X3RZF0_9ACTN|nr:cupin domain-containing protein [Solirubrobacter ginsenosidimutans]MDA0160079.1 cupin domain-containing protein [Solirubrobacter ginsenosidimutans]